MGVPWAVLTAQQSPSRAGGREISLGFESGNKRILKSMNKRFTPEDVRCCCGIFKDHGIRVTGFLMLGGTGETRQSVEDSVTFVHHEFQINIDFKMSCHL